MRIDRLPAPSKKQLSMSATSNEREIERTIYVLLIVVEPRISLEMQFFIERERRNFISCEKITFSSNISEDREKIVKFSNSKILGC